MSDLHSGTMDQFTENSTVAPKKVRRGKGAKVPAPQAGDQFVPDEEEDDEDGDEGLTAFDLGKDEIDSPCPNVPPVDGRQPKVGDFVLYYYEENGKLLPAPMQLIHKLIDGTWNANVHKFRHIVGRHAVRFSPTPRTGCWTWSE